MKIKSYIGELWVNIKGTGGQYQISNFNRVKSKGNAFGRKEKLLKQSQNPRTGYWNVVLRVNGVQKSCYVHKLVAGAFIPNPKHLPCVNHKDCDRSNNRLSNLEWVSYKTNVNYKDAQKKRIASFKQHIIENPGCFYGKRKNAKQIIQYTLEGVYVKEYKSVCEASRVTGFSRANISACVIGRTQTSNGYVWKYKGEPFIKPIYKPHSHRVYTGGSKTRPVVQFNNSGIEQHYSSIVEAARITGINKTSIRRCCKKEKGYPRAGGFYWEYEELFKNNLEN